MTKPHYDLVRKSRKFRDQTLYSYYFRSDKLIEKRFQPVDIDGCRYRQDKLTGEITTYSKDIVELSNAASVRRSRIILNMILDMNDFDWFVTLTFDNQMVDRTNAEAVYNCYKKYIDNLKHKYPYLRYIFIPEKHEDGCYHFHGLIGGCSMKELGMINSGKVCCHWSNKNGICSKEYFEKTKADHELKETDGEAIYNLMTFQYGFTTASRIISRERCNTYVKKYIDKNFGSTDIFRKRFFYSSNLEVPEIAERLIGADFVHPEDMDKISAVTNSALFMYSEKQRYNEKFNNMQFWVDNEHAPYLEKELIPVELIPGQVDMEDLIDFDLV